MATKEPKKYIFDARGQYVLNPEWEKWNAEQQQLSPLGNQTKQGNQTQQVSFKLPEYARPKEPEEPQQQPKEESLMVKPKVPPYIQKLKDIINDPNSTPEQKRQANLEMGQYDVERIKAGGPQTLSVAREEEVAQQTAARKQAIQKAIQLAQQGVLSTEELQALGGADPDIKEALGAGLVGTAPGIIAGAAGGLVTGATVGALGGPIGAAGGAVLGAIGGGIGTFLSSVRGNLKAQQSGEYTADRQSLTRGLTALNMLITDTNQFPDHAPENILLFQGVLNDIDKAHAKTWKDSQEDLNRFLGNDGTPELARFEAFNTQLRQIYIQRFYAAVGNPDPTATISQEEMQLMADLIGSEE